MRDVANEFGYKIPLTVASSPKRDKEKTTSYKNVMEINKDDCSGYFKRLEDYYSSYPVVHQEDVLIPPTYNPVTSRKVTWREEYKD